MARSLKTAARGKQPKKPKDAQSRGRVGAAASRVAVAWLRQNRLRNLAVAGAAIVALTLALSAAVPRPERVPSGGPALDASGNAVARAWDRVAVSQSDPEDGFDFDRAAIDAVLKPVAAKAAPTAVETVEIATYANGDAVPTDPVRFAASEPQVTDRDAGREAQASIPPDPRAEAGAVPRDARTVAPSVRYDRHASLPGTGGGSAAGGGFNGNALIAEARKYIGTNPTRRATLWCGAFLDMVLRKTGHRGGGNLALAYTRYGKRIPGPRVGAIVVLRRKGGGHVGIVTGVDSNGNPIIISGNHNHRVAVATYPRSRVVAYVVPQ
jgi:uncharacterized protein (TIGR02594 family)